MPHPPSAPPTYPLSLPDFENALRKGHGRAILTLQCVNDTRPYRDAVLRACLEDQRFERTVEPVRSVFAADSALLCADPEPLADVLVRQLLNTSSDDDSGILFDVVVELAKRDYPGARRAVRAEIDRTSALERDGIGWAMIEVFGLDGLIELAESVGGDVPEDDQWQYGVWLRDAGELFGEAEARFAIVAAAERSERVTAFLTATDARDFGAELERVREERPSANVPWPVMWDRVVEAAARGATSSSVNIVRWAQEADEQQLRCVAQALLVEDDLSLVQILARVFDSINPWPGTLVSALVRRLHEVDSPIADRLMRSTQSTEHPTLRDECLRRLSERRISGEILNLLQSNYLQRDHAAIERALFAADLDDKIIHSLGHALEDIFEDEHAAEGRRLLLWLYEFNPCSFCRWSVLHCLMKNDLAPAYIIEEAAFDANPETRELALHGVNDNGE